MLSPTDILQHTAHRPWPVPNNDWIYYQEWNQALFFHWPVPQDVLQPFLPEGLYLDTFNGEAWVSIVPFTMQNIRPRFIPAFPPVSDFHEINMRTYVIKNGKPGVYFLNIEAEKWLSSLIAETLSGLPYQQSNITRNTATGQWASYFSPKEFALNLQYQINAPVLHKTPLDIFLTERYCLYLNIQNHLYRYDIHHLPWELYSVSFTRQYISYRINTFNFSSLPALTHYSPGVQVIAWKRMLL